MYIGKLNDKIGNISFECTKKNSKTVPPFLEYGNPVNDELLRVKWSKLTTDGVDLHLSFEKEQYLSSLVIYLQDECCPKALTVYNSDKSVQYSQHVAETGATVTDKTLALTVDAKLSGLVIEIDADFTDIIIDKIELYGAIFEGEKLFPEVSSFAVKDGTVAPKTVAAKTELANAAISVLCEKFEEKTGIALEKADAADITFILDTSVAADGCKISADKKITVAASNKRGFIQGAETLIKLTENGAVPCCEIKDEPFREFRGVHLFLPAEDQMDFAKRLIKYLLSPLGYNFIILQFSAAMVLDKHPEINASFLEAIDKSSKGEWPEFPHNAVGGGKLVSKESVRDFVEYSRAYGIEIVPEIQSLGHVQYLTLSHPEIAEISAEEAEAIDARQEDVPPSEFYKHSFCPSNPKSYELLFEVADEIIDVVKPERYVHFGHDEVYQLGICPICKNRDPADILADDIIKLHTYLKDRGLKMMIWGDMLQPVTKYKAFDAIKKIPKDILLLDFIWYFHLDKDIEDNLVAHDFDVLFGNLYSSHFPRYEKRIRTNRIRGGQISAWVKTAEYELGREGKLYDMIYTAQMLWSERYSRHLRYAYDKLIRELIPSLRPVLQYADYPSASAGAKTTEIDMTSVNECYDSIIFDHYTNSYIRRQPWVELETVAKYTVAYEDGTTIDIPLTYGGNICHFDRKQNQPFSAKFYRHNGYCGTWFTDSYEIIKDSKPACVYSYEWINPQPCKKITAVTLSVLAESETDITVVRTRGVKK